MKIFYHLLLVSCLCSLIIADDPLETYCTQNGGIVINMIAYFDTKLGMVKGLQKKFCRILFSGNLGYIGLETLGSDSPSLAGTYSKSLVIDPSKIIKGPFSNSNLNLCYSLGGGNIVYYLKDGGFTDEYGQIDICIFGDGSSVAAWTLFYMGIGKRLDIKNAIVGSPLNIALPNIPYV